MRKLLPALLLLFSLNSYGQLIYGNTFPFWNVTGPLTVDGTSTFNGPAVFNGSVTGITAGGLSSPATITGGTYNASTNNTAFTISAPHGAPGAGTGIGQTIVVENGSRSGLDINMGTSLSGGKKALRIWNPGAVGTPDMPAYINARGAYHTQAWMTISGAWSGSGDSTVIEQPSADTYMVGVWADVENSYVSRTANMDNTAEGANHFLLMDSLGTNSAKRYIGRIASDLSLRWQAPSETTKNIEDVVLERSAAATLRLRGTAVAGPAVLLLQNNGAIRQRNAGNTADLNIAQIDSTNALTIGNTSGDFLLLQASAGRTIRAYNAAQSAYLLYIEEASRKVAFGTNDVSAGYFTIYDTTATTGDSALALRAGAARPARLRFGDNAGTFDTGLVRDSAGVLAVTDSSTTLTNYATLKSARVILAGSTEPTCDATTRGTLVQVNGGAGVADTVRICTKDAADVYAYRAIF